MVLTANKGVALVVMDNDMYIEKIMSLLKDQEVYQECKHQTKSIHAKVFKQLHDLKKSMIKIQGSIHQTLPSWWQQPSWQVLWFAKNPLCQHPP